MTTRFSSRVALAALIALSVLSSATHAFADPAWIVGTNPAGPQGFYRPTGWSSTLFPADWHAGYADSDGRAVADFSYAGYRRGDVPIPRLGGALTVDVTAEEWGADPLGLSDSTEAIQSAIDYVGSKGGGVVYLPAGRYLVRPDWDSNQALLIHDDNVVLRGAGREATFIQNTSWWMERSSVIAAVPTGAVRWTLPTVDGGPNLAGDSLAGSWSVKVTNPQSFSVGQLIVIRTEATPEWLAERGNPRDWRASTHDATTYLRRVTAVDLDGTLSIDIPLRSDVLLRDRGDLPNVYPAATHLSGVGIEDVSIGMVAHPGSLDIIATEVHESSAIRLTNVIDGWVQRVGTFAPPGNQPDVHLLSEGLWLQYCRGITVRGCEFGFPQYTGGGNGNGVVIRASDCLIDDCSIVRARHSYTFGMWYATGNVVRASTSYKPVLATDFHMWFSAVNLIEDMVFDGDWIDASYRYDGADGVHGHTTSQSVIWNIASVGAPTTSEGNHPTALVQSIQWDWGAVVGTSGVFSRVAVDPLRDGVSADPRTDLAEGVGWGTTLVPRSLYADQLGRRHGVRVDGAGVVSGAVLLPPRPILATLDASRGVEVTAVAPPITRVRRGSRLVLGYDLNARQRVTRARLVVTGKPGRRSALLRVKVLGSGDSTRTAVLIASSRRVRWPLVTYVYDVSSLVRARQLGARPGRIAFELSEDSGLPDALVDVTTAAGAQRGIAPRLELETAVDPALRLASVSARGSGTAASAVDGNPNTSFTASRVGDALTIDLGRERQVSGVGVSFAAPVRSFAYADVRVSSNGKRWVPVRSIQGLSTLRSKTVFPFDAPVGARYVRVVLCGTSNPLAARFGQVRDLEVYGR